MEDEKILDKQTRDRGGWKGRITLKIAKTPKPHRSPKKNETERVEKSCLSRELLEWY